MKTSRERCEAVFITPVFKKDGHTVETSVKSRKKKLNNDARLARKEQIQRNAGRK